ncbi:MAG: glycosyltransferase [Rubrivivax sp.]
MSAHAAEPWLSVLIPVYNVEPYLRDCVDSVLSQADQGVEVLLLDDRSTDGSAALMQQLAAAAPRLRLLAHERNRGLSAARNTLMQAARGRHLWFLDSDDMLEPGTLAPVRQQLQRVDAPDLLFVDYRVWRQRPALKHRLRGEFHRRSFVGPTRQLLGGGPAALEGALASGNQFAWAHVSARRLWADATLRFPEGRSFEDMATTPRLVLRAASVLHLDHVAVRYRRRDDSLSALMSAAKVADLSAALRGFRTELLQRWPDAPPATRFAVAHQCARNLVAAVRHARRLPPGEGAALLPRLREDFRAAVGDDLPLLLRQYRRRGWWARSWALQRALR